MRTQKQWKRAMRGPSGRRCLPEMLESRLMLSAADPSGQEQELLWLLNRFRTNPADELALMLKGDANVQQALDYFKVDRTLLESQWAGLSAVQPVGWNAQLATAAAGHNDAMAVADVQSHQVPGEPDLAARITTAGYAYDSAGENVFAFGVTMIHTHAAFGIDWGDGPGGIQQPAGHRVNMMNGVYREVGVAVMRHSGGNTGPYLITQDFGSPATPANPLVVGTTWRDGNTDGAYNAGEGIGGVVVTARGSQGTFSTTSLSAGGYQLTLPNGSYTLTFTGAAVPSGTQTLNVTVNGQNVLQDLNTALISEGGGGTGTAPPRGSLDVVKRWPTGAPRQVQGWAADVDAGTNGSGAVQVRLEVDGIAVQTAQAGARRQDLLATVGSTDHGYTLDVPALAPGTHVLEIFALDAPTGTAVSIGKRTVTVGESVFGSVDVLDAGRIAGWVFDPAAGNGGGDPVKVRIDVDGVAGAPAPASTPRMDLVAPFGTPNHGFAVPTPAVGVGAHKYDVYAIGANGAAVLLASKMVTVSTAPRGSLDAAGVNMIGGWVMDPDSPSASANIRVDIDGVGYRATTTSKARGDLAAIGPGAYGFEMISPALGLGNHVITLYGIDDKSGQAVLIGTKSITVSAAANRLPMGSIDLFSIGQVAGWVVDADAQTQPVAVRLVVDGIDVMIASAAASRPDLGALFAGTAHGFVINVPSLASGGHRIELYAQDLQNAQWKLLGGKDVAIA